jgi:glutamine amidotransferase-like uncharacterized protein
MRICLITSDADTVSASCVSATLSLLCGTRVHTGTLDATDVNDKELACFDAVLITGGEPRRLRDRLGGRGASAIRAFIASGGGYIGVCAGAVLATRKAPTLDLLPTVRCVNDNVWWASGLTGTVTLRRPTQTFSDPVDASLSTAFIEVDTHAYQNGPLLRIKDRSTTAPMALALFSSDVEPWEPDMDETAPPRGQMEGAVAVVLGRHGLGRVLITSVHPEFLSDGALLETMCLHVIRE